MRDLFLRIRFGLLLRREKAEVRAVADDAFDERGTGGGRNTDEDIGDRADRGWPLVRLASLDFYENKIFVFDLTNDVTDFIYFLFLLMDGKTA